MVWQAKHVILLQPLSRWMRTPHFLLGHFLESLDSAASSAAVQADAVGMGNRKQLRQQPSPRRNGAAACVRISSDDHRHHHHLHPHHHAADSPPPWATSVSHNLTSSHSAGLCPPTRLQDQQKQWPRPQVTSMAPPPSQLSIWSQPRCGHVATPRAPDRNEFICRARQRE